MKAKWQMKSVEYPMRDDIGKALLEEGWEPFSAIPLGASGIHLVYFRKLDSPTKNVWTSKVVVK